MLKQFFTTLTSNMVKLHPCCPPENMQPLVLHRRWARSTLHKNWYYLGHKEYYTTYWNVRGPTSGWCYQYIHPLAAASCCLYLPQIYHHTSPCPRNQQCNANPRQSKLIYIGRSLCTSHSCCVHCSKTVVKFEADTTVLGWNRLHDPGVKPGELVIREQPSL